MVGKWLTARNARTFSIYELLFIITIVLPLLAWTSIAFFVTSFCFSCFMTQSCLLRRMLLELFQLGICFNCLVAKMRYAFCHLVSTSFIAFSVYIIRLVEYVVSGFSMLYWKPRFKSFISSFVNLISV